ncbi:ABC transporter permease [Nakamurella leprariae]|uniref:ABC transporter permease n=1 Tax=Nakamurella leprariae TaxID=2803911 RepID=A0A939C092_9ACTN|nr:ABC transporter permease [Nakamurella leprariae]MBM9468985.1 ABC transporter permease [Nakamurella leprariae]
MTASPTVRTDPAVDPGPAVPAGAGGPARWRWAVGGTLVVLALAELLPRTGVLPSAHLPPLSAVVEALVEQLGRPSFWTATGQTMLGWLVGGAAAVLAGTVAGFLLGVVPAVRRATASTLDFLRPVPAVALVPVAILLFGTQLESKVLLVVWAAIWPVLMQVVAGLAEVDPVARETAAALHLSPAQRLRHLIAPSVLPAWWTGLRLSVSVALVMTVAAELIIGNAGLGKAVALAQDGGVVPQMYALIAVTGVLGVIADVLVRAAERRLMPWHVSHRAGIGRGASW